MIGSIPIVQDRLANILILCQLSLCGMFSRNKDCWCPNVCVSLCCVFPTGYTTVMIDQGEECIWQRERCVNRHGLLSAVQLKSLFARHVSRAITELGYQRYNIVYI